MKKILFILFATLLFCGEAWAAIPTVPPSQLQSGHYYRIRNKSGSYMCWAGQEYPTANNQALGMLQPVIFISKEKARTEPGTIWLLTGSGPNNWQLEAQGVNFRNEMNNKFVSYETAIHALFITQRGVTLNTRTFEFKWPENNTDNRVAIHVGASGASDKTVWLEPKHNNYLNVTGTDDGALPSDSYVFYFEEVDGIDNYLGFPPSNYDYTNTGTLYTRDYLTNETSQTGTWSGSGRYQITDVTSGQDADNTTWYYATMCLPFPVEVPSNVRCFFVNSSMQAVPIEYSDDNNEYNARTGKLIATHNVIPAGTPFLAAATNSDPTVNRFKPYIRSTNPAAPTNAGGNNNALNTAQKNSTTINYLVADASTNYTSTYYTLSGVSSDGKLEFNTLASEKTDGNRAFMGVPVEIVVPPPAEVQLADLIYETVTENNKSLAKWTEKDLVKISDDLLVCYVNKNAGLVFARDDKNNKNYWSKVENTPDNYYHFDPENENGVQQLLLPEDYDQSNWVIIRATGYDFKVGQTINGNSLKGCIESDKSRPTFVVFDYEADNTQSNNQTVTLNTYSVAHLMADENHLLESGVDGKGSYFFMTPKPAEVANVTWAILKKVDGNVYAYVPAKDDNNNALDFHGRVLLNPGMYAGAMSDWSEDKLNAMLAKIDGQGICFKAVILPVNEESSGSNAPRRASINEGDDVSPYYVVYPLEFQVDGEGNPVVTSVKGVTTIATVKSVKFYNLQGVESDVPFDGINIVVEQLNDGTTRSSKMLF